MENEKNYFETNMKILQFAMKKWKLLFGIVVVAGILAAVFSSPNFIPPKYTSMAVIYPANLGNYSGETRLEQMMQYSESNAIRDTLIRKFSLYDEYEIDSTKLSSRNAIYKVYDENISFDETKYESIEINASSIDPVKSKQMVEEIIEQINLIIRRTEREKYQEVVIMHKYLLDIKKAHVDSMLAKIKEYSVKYGILDYIGQSEEVTEGYLKFLISGKKGSDFDEAKRLYNNLEKYGREFHGFHAQLNSFNSEYIKRLHNYEAALKDLNKVQTYSNIIVKPEVPDKKSYPIRWLIVLVASASAGFFAFVVLLFFGFQNKD